MPDPLPALLVARVNDLRSNGKFGQIIRCLFSFDQMETSCRIIMPLCKP